MFKNILCLLFILCMLAGCISVSSSPRVRLYTLEPISIESKDDFLTDLRILEGLTIGIGPVSIPEYCSRPQMVVWGKDGFLSLAQFDRWAEPLEEAVARTVTQNLLNLVPKANILIFPWSASLMVKYQVVLRILQLECKMNSGIRASLQYLIVDARTKKIVSSSLKEYEQKITENSYSGVAKGISRLCALFSRDIAQSLIRLMQDKARLEK